MILDYGQQYVPGALNTLFAYTGNESEPAKFEIEINVPYGVYIQRSTNNAWEYTQIIFTGERFDL